MWKELENISPFHILNNIDSVFWGKQTQIEDGLLNPKVLEENILRGC